MTDTTQTVVDETKAAATPAATDDSARATDNLDDLLAKFDQETQKTPPNTPPETKTPPQPPPVSEDRIRRVEDRLFKQDFEEVVSNIKGDLKVPPRWAKGWIDQMARENPKIATAFMNRDSDPGTWKRIESTLNKEMAKDFEELTAVDKDATVDREAVTASLKGASTKVSAEPPPKLDNMSPSEFRKHVRENYGFDPG